MGDRLKSAVELALERLKQTGDVPSAPLTDQQKQQIAEVRNRTAAKLAEQEILHKAELAKLASLPPAEAAGQRLKLQQNFQDDRQRLERERDSRIERIRSQAGPA
jgi:hypothetical protein